MDSTAASFLGVWVPSGYAQSDGPEAVLQSVRSVGATAICLTTTVLQPQPDGVGARMPDLHRDGWSRVLERPLFGRGELWVTSHAGYDADPRPYDDGPYGPPRPATEQTPDPGAGRRLAAQAAAAGLQVYVHLQPTVPAGLRAEDAPVAVGGTPGSADRASPAGCPNRPTIRAYAAALLTDTVTNFGPIDGVLVDWAEYPTYQLHELFTCFCAHCRTRAEELGLDWDRMLAAAAALRRWCGEVTPDGLALLRRGLTGRFPLVDLLLREPGWLDILRLKAESVADLYRLLHKQLAALGRTDVTLAARGWPPPWNLASGTDYARLSESCGMFAPKLFTFDLAALPGWWGAEWREWNPGLDEPDVLDALVDVLELPDDLAPRRLAQYRIPAPGESHHVAQTALDDRIAQVARQLAGTAGRLCPIVHSYLPPDEWRRMLRSARAADIDGVWVQMYGYLTDEKLAILRETWAERPDAAQQRGRRG